MTRYVLLSVALMCQAVITATCQSSGRISAIDGVWANILNTDSEKAYIIAKKKKMLNFVYASPENTFDFPLYENLHGFQNIDSGNYHALDTFTIKENGKFYTVIDRQGIKDGTVIRPYYETPGEFSCDGSYMSIYGTGKLVEYHKLPFIPYEALQMLYLRGVADSRDYISEYIGIHVARIKSPLKSRGYLLSAGQLVRILKERKTRYFIKTFDESPFLRWVDKDLFEIPLKKT